MFRKIFKKSQLFPLEPKDWLVLFGGLAVFTAISLPTIASSSIWFDEAFGAYLIRFDFWDIARYTASDVHPPVYYWLLKIWSYLFGNSEFALRSMSVLCMAVAIFFGFVLVKRLFNRQAAWTSLVFMVLAPMLIRYSQEIRMYALVSAIALAATYTLVVAMESKRKLPWIIYGLLVGLGMWTHYFSALIWLSHWAWRAWTLRGAGQKKFARLFFTKEWILAHVIAVGFFLPWMPALIHQVLDVQINGFWIPPVAPSTLPNFFTNVLYYQDQDTVGSWMTLAGMVIIISLIVLAVRLYGRQNKAERTNYMLVFAVAFMPVVLLFVLSMPPVRSSFIDRYLVPATLGISLFIGVTLALSTRLIGQKLRIGLLVLIAGSMVFGITNVYHLGNYNKTLHTSNNTRQTIEALTAKSTGNEPIITDSPWLFYEAVFYSTDKHPVYFIDANIDYRYGSLDMLKYNDQHKVKDLAAFTKDHPKVWYMGRPGNGSFGAPEKNWKPLQEVEINDSVSGNPAYKAIDYQTN